ncbi:MAG: GNAT family N-acetyltransferase [Bacteroidetes bacterium]|nr:GNAT family N-acetyltransferase [Bacteroidota bacterium]
MFENIIDPIDRETLKRELTQDIFIRPTNNASNEIYIFKGDEKPNLMKEVGRLREVSFRAAGGGTGKPLDVDEFDSGPYSYSQLIVWDPSENAIVGGYRVVLCKDTQDNEGNFHLSTTEIFQFSERLKRDYFPYAIELGRSFVQPEFQPSVGSRKGLFSLDNLWDGLGALVVMHPEMKYFFGKITMYTDFNREARDTILRFMHHYFPDPDGLAIVDSPVVLEYECKDFMEKLQGLDYKDGHKLLNTTVRDLGENIPPLFNNYMNLSPTMRTFGTTTNSHFGDVEETGIMVTIQDIYDQKKDRYVLPYLEYLKSKNK